MTAPPQRRCQAPGCEKPIPAERRHPSTKTCSDTCRDAYKNYKQSRFQRKKRKDARLQEAAELRKVRAAEAAELRKVRAAEAAELRKVRAAEAIRANGWQGLPCDHYLRLSCAEWGLKLGFDNSIPQGHTAASWLREILVILMRTQGLGTWALNELVAVPGHTEKEDRIAHGSKQLRSRVPSFLWDDICKRAKREQATSATSWLRKRLYRAVWSIEYWYPQTYDQWLALEYAALRAAGRADQHFHDLARRLEPYKPAYHPLHVQGRRTAVPEHLLVQAPHAYNAHVQAIIAHAHLSGQADLPASVRSYLSGQTTDPPAKNIWYQVEALKSAGQYEEAETLRQEIGAMLRQERRVL